MQRLSALLLVALGSCSSGEARVEVSATLQKALAAMEKDGKPGLVVRIPEDEASRDSLGWTLAKCGSPAQVSSSGAANPWDPIYDAHELLLEARVVCLESMEVDRCVPGAKPNENLIVIDGSGDRCGGTEVNLRSVEGLVRGAQELLHTESATGLRARASGTFGFLDGRAPEALTEFLTSPVTLSHAKEYLPKMQQVGSWVLVSRKAESKAAAVLSRATFLLSQFDSAPGANRSLPVVEVALERLPFVIQQRVDAPTESVRLRARALVEAIYWAEVDLAQAEVLPFGVELETTLESHFTYSTASTHSSRAATSLRFVRFRGR